MGYRRITEEERAFRETPEWKAEFRKKRNVYATRYRKKNKEKCAAATKKSVQKNKPAAEARKKAWQAANRERVRRNTRACDLKKYGITLAEYEAMVSEQCGLCLICGSPDPKRSLAVDHCHTTGVVRGLLCSHCNFMIGHSKDDPMRLLAGAAYLRKQQ